MAMTTPSAPHHSNTGSSAAQDALLEWRVHLAAREPRRAALLIAVVASASMGSAFLFRHPLPGAAALLLLLGATGEYLFPITYRLTTVGAEMRNLFAWRRIAWADVRRIYRSGDEVKLSPLRHGGRREAFRGVHLRCEGRQERVLEVVRRCCPDAVGREA